MNSSAVVKVMICSVKPVSATNTGQLWICGRKARRTKTKSLVLALQPTELSYKLPQFRRRLGLMPLLVVVIEPPCCSVQDTSDDGKILVAEFGKERVGGGAEEVFSLARRKGAEGGLGWSGGGSSRCRVEEIRVNFDMSCEEKEVRTAAEVENNDETYSS